MFKEKLSEWTIQILLSLNNNTSQSNSMSYHIVQKNDHGNSELEFENVTTMQQHIKITPTFTHIPSPSSEHLMFYSVQLSGFLLACFFTHVGHFLLFRLDSRH